MIQTLIKNQREYEIKTNNDEGHTYLDKVPGDYFGYVYLRVVAEASGGNNAD